MLETITSAGYDLDLVRDLWRILATGWTETEMRVLALLFMLVIFPVVQEIRDR